MGSCEQDLKTLDHTLELLIKGKINADTSSAIINTVNAKTKVRNQMLQVRAHGLKEARKGKPWAIEVGMTGGIISNTDPENELIHCRDREAECTRKACKSYSSMTPNIETCQTCEHWKLTRQLLANVEV